MPLDSKALLSMDLSALESQTGESAARQGPDSDFQGKKFKEAFSVRVRNPESDTPSNFAP